MEKHRAIPPGYRTVGELAKKMNTTVRTLQYYDKEGLLSPSAESEGGRRLYADKDVVRLHQIQSMKYLGFSLGDIKNRLVSFETPAQFADALSEQAAHIREKLASLEEVLRAIEALRAETLQMQSLDFEKYAAIIVNLQMKNEFYGLIKHFDDKTLDFLHSRFDQESGTAVLGTLHRLLGEAAALQASGIPPGSERGLAFAKAWWDMVIEFTGGDTGLLPDLLKIAEIKDTGEAWNEKWAAVGGFIENSLGAYFAAIEFDPLEGVVQ